MKNAPPIFYRPWARYQQVDTPATVAPTRTDPEEFKNDSDHDILISRVLIDVASYTDQIDVRFGIRGRDALTDDYVRAECFQNTLLMNQATDCAWPLLVLRKPVRLPPRQAFNVELEDTVVGGARICNVMLNARTEKPSPYTGQPVPFALAKKVTIPDGGRTVARMQSDQNQPLVLTDLSLYLEETGTAARLRGLNVRCRGGGLPDWSQDLIVASVFFPDRNGAARVWEPPGGFIRLRPGDALEFEIFDGTGSSTIYIGMVGYARDRSR